MAKRVLTLTIHAPYGNELEKHLNAYLDSFGLIGTFFDTDVEWSWATVTETGE